jgi:hypothetical protein
MAASYTTTQAVTLATRAAAYERLANVFLHLDSLDLNLISVVRNADNTITFTFDKPISKPEQIPHLGF